MENKKYLKLCGVLGGRPTPLAVRRLVLRLRLEEVWQLLHLDGGRRLRARG